MKYYAWWIFAAPICRRRTSWLDSVLRVVYLVHGGVYGVIGRVKVHEPRLNPNSDLGG